ncbi:unnamed protein product, partial [Nesidiocoris tenuis]
MGGGVKLSSGKLKVLAYADDIVLMASNPASLQLMINDLEVYCKKWGLIINLAKSKTMVFKKGGKPARAERWYLSGREIETVRSYKYLGVQFTSTLTWDRHLEEKRNAVVAAVGLLWAPLFGNGQVGLSSKLKVFDAAIGAIMCYGAEVWGYQKSSKVDQAQIVCLRKIFGLHTTSPHYLIYMETGRRPLSAHTWQQHGNYVLKTLALQEKRLPNIITKELMRRGRGWAAVWRAEADRLHIHIDFAEGRPEIEKSWQQISVARAAEEESAWLQRARDSVFHAHYQKVFAQGQTASYLSSASLRAI